jgi:cytochrome c biogenesis protein CcmG, thiol:disulfide interchange protein DsbE
VKRSAVPIAAILAAAALVGLLVYGVAQKGENHSLEDAIANGKRPAAPSRALPLLEGSGERSLASYEGKPVLLNFWASWCDPCKDEAPLLERAQERLSAAGGTVLGVTFRDAAPDSVKFVDEFGLSFPSLRDVEGKLAQDYGTRALPETFMIDRDGKVVAVSRGVVSEKFIDHALEQAGV